MNKEPIRVLHIVAIMNRGGIETFLMNIYRKIDRSKVQFDFLVTREEVGVFDDEIYSLGGKIFNIPHVKKVGLIQYKKNVKEFFRNHEGYRIVHCHMNSWSGLFLPIAKSFGVPIRIAHSHIADYKLSLRECANYLVKKYNSFFIKNSATNLFACGHKAGEYLFGKNLSRHKVEVINNGIDVEKYRYNEKIAKSVREKLGIPVNSFVIGHVGRFNYQKNHDYLIEILKEICKKRPNAILLLVGEGELRDSIQKKVNKLGLLNNVKFLGVRNDVHELMMAFDVFLFPSLFEGFPVTIIEAQASGLECVVSNTISSEVNLQMGLVDFVSLEEAPELWATKVLKSRIKDRKISQNPLIDLGYDSKTTAKKLQNFYLNI